MSTSNVSGASLSTRGLGLEELVGLVAVAIGECLGTLSSDVRVLNLIFVWLEVYFGSRLES